MPAPASPSDALRAPEFLGALRSAASVLEDHAAALDRLEAAEAWDAAVEVEDSPDGPEGPPATGPGTDLARTLAAACAGADGASDLTSLSSRLAEGARTGAELESGRRLARFLAGAADAMRNADRLDGTRIALALEAGAERLTEADDGAHPGGLPAVVAAAADAALSAVDDGADLGDVLVSAADGGLAELETGPTGGRAAVRTGHRRRGRRRVPAHRRRRWPAWSPANRCRRRPGTRPPVPSAAAATWCGPRSTPPGGPDPEAAAHLEVLWHELGDIVDFTGPRGRSGTWRCTPRCPAPRSRPWSTPAGPASCTSRCWTSRPVETGAERRSGDDDVVGGPSGRGEGTGRPRPPSRSRTWTACRSSGSAASAPRSSRAFGACGWTSLYDLITHYPRRYVDRTREARIAELAPGEEALVLGPGHLGVVPAGPERQAARGDRGPRRERRLRCTFFNQPWRERQLARLDGGSGAPALEVAVFGRVEVFNGAGAR